jgi:hypothetical protein
MRALAIILVCVSEDDALHAADVRLLTLVKHQAQIAIAIHD